MIAPAGISLFKTPLFFFFQFFSYYGQLVSAEYLSMKEDSLFCFVIMRSTEPGCFRSCSWCLWKALEQEGAWALFHDVWTGGAKVLEY